VENDNSCEMVLYVVLVVNMISVLKQTSCWELIVLKSKVRMQMRCMNTDSHRKVSLNPLFFWKILSVLSEPSDRAPIQSIF
jgi:hypothetical protein